MSEKLMKYKEPNRWKRFKNRFFKWGIDLCDGKWPYYGGHTHWMCNLLGVDYLQISLCLGIGHHHFYYDGQHHTLELCFIAIHWGGAPYSDM